jgi:hypothetical protein
MATIHISNRALNQSARQAINDVHGDPVWGIAEAVINAFTAMRHMESQHRPHNSKGRQEPERYTHSRTWYRDNQLRVH